MEVWLMLCVTMVMQIIHACGDGKHVNKMNQFADKQKDTVHLVFMNHLDIGYNAQMDKAERGFVNVVLNRYFGEFFPRAARVGEELSRGGYVETFTYTTHPWLVALYLDCPQNLVLSGIKLNCPNDTAVSQILSAVRNGYITWHAAPHNMLTEYNDRWLIERGLRLSSELDVRLNITRLIRVMSQRDVPGLTHAIIPSLLDMGITGLSVGVNALSSPPDVPRLFRWAYKGKEIMAAWHPGGYPNSPGPLPQQPGGLSKSDCVTYTGLHHTLCFAFRTDNTGPPESVEEVLGYYEILRAEYPAATIQASTLEDFFIHVQTIKDKLPLVTKEIGDTWIQGVASDPRRNAEYRTVSRTLGDCVRKGLCSLKDGRFLRSSLMMLKLAEHTWGLNSAYDIVHWSNKQFYRNMTSANFENCTRSWLEQRAFLSLSIEALQDHPVVPEIKEQLLKLAAKQPDLKDYTEVMYLPQCKGKNFDLGFDIQGSISRLRHGKILWSDRLHPLSRFQYVTYNETDFQNFGKYYNYTNNQGPGIVKENITDSAHPISTTWDFKVIRAFMRKGIDCDVWFYMASIDMVPVHQYGAPNEVWIHYDIKDSDTTLDIDIEMVLFDKVTTRLPEALFLSFYPICNDRNCAWRYSKLGRLIDPHNVVHNGSQYQHGVDDGGVTITDQSQHSMQIIAWDTTVACPITNNMIYPTVFPAPLQPIADQITGVGLDLYNNIWDTNWIFWYPYVYSDKDFKSRYKIKLT